jgi:hypothetical protein
VDSSGNLYVADSNNNRVLFYPAGSGNGAAATKVYGQLGSLTSDTGNNGGISANSLAFPFAVALDSGGNLYVSDSNNNRMLAYPAGSTTATEVYGQLGSFTTDIANDGGVSANSLYTPYGVALDGNGNVYVCDENNNRVLMYPALYPPSPVVAVAITNNPTTFLQGGEGSLTITATNTSNVAASSSLNLTTVLPVGLTPVSLVPVNNNFSCNQSTLTCTPPAGGGLPANTAVSFDLSVNVAPNASVGANTLTVSSTASGGGIAGNVTGLDMISVMGTQTITFTTNAPATAAYNAMFTVAATGGASGNPVVFTSSGSCTNSGATYTMTSGAGTCFVIANQAGNSNYQAAPQVTQPVNATQLSQAITFTTNAPGNAAYNAMFTVAATGGASGNQVMFTSSGSCTNSGATYTMTSGTGTCSVIANQAGNDNYSAATQVTQTVNATQLTQTITFTTSPPPSAQYGTNFMVAATGGASGNPVMFTSSGGCSNTGGTYTMTSGTTACSVIADQAGDNNYAASEVTTSVAATLAPDAITFTTNPPSSAQYGTNFTVAATGGGSSNPVVFTSSGACGNSGANYSMTSGSGTCSVIANQAADNNYSAATPVVIPVNATPAPQTISFTMNAPPTAAYNTQFTVAATGGASGNTVMFTSGGSCSNTLGTYTITSGTGTCSVIANQQGNANYSAALQVMETTNDTRIGQTITFPAIPNQNGPGQITLNATASSGLAVSYSVLSGPATVNGNILTTTASGNVTVEADQGGNGNYTAASAVQQTFTVIGNAGNLNGSNCNGEFTGVYQGNLTVTSGQVCIFSNGGITGNLKNNGGTVVLENNSSANGNLQMTAGSLTVSNSTVGKDLQISGASSFTIGPAANIGGNLQIQNIPTGAGTNQVCGASIGGNLQFQNNGTAAQIGSRTGCAGNNVSGNLQVQNNTASTTVDGNTVSGNLQDQNNSAATEVFTNVVTHNLQCQQNISITGGGDTAGGNKQGQCSTY